jgi:hypothetical protein
MRKMRGGASLTTLASAHRQSPLADCAGGRAGARVIHRSPARATSFRGSFYLSLLETSVDRAGRRTLFFVLFDMDVAVFDRCTSLPLFTSAIVPLHVSTTILDRRQTEARLLLGPGTVWG